MALSYRIYLFHFIERRKERLAKGEVAETGLCKMVHDPGRGIKGRVLVEGALVLPLLVFPAQRALAVDEPDHERSAWLEHAPGLAEGQVHVVKEADRGYHEGEVELVVGKGQLLGHSGKDLDPLALRKPGHCPRRLDASRDPEGSGKPSRPDADLDPAAFRQEFPDRAHFGQVGKRMIDEPLLVLFYVPVKGFYTRHGTPRVCSLVYFSGCLVWPSIGAPIQQQESWQFQKSFTSPDPNNTNFILIVPINDAKRRGNDLSQMFDIELRYDTTRERVCAQPLDLGNDLSSKPLSHIRRTVAQVKGLHVLKVFNC